MRLVRVRCAHCGKFVRKSASEVNRARRGGFALYCSRVCFGLAHRANRSSDELKRMKAEYDAQRRADLRDEILAAKREYHRRTYNPDAAREYRKNRTFDHSAYCRRYYADPKKKAEKIEYDIQRRGLAYADFAEAWRLLIELEREIRARCPDKYERQKGRGYFTRIQERKHRDHQDRRTA